MPTSAETQAIRDFLFENPEHLKIGLAVYQSWPSIRDFVSEKFLKRLSTHIRQNDSIRKYDPGLQIDCVFKGDAARASRLWLFSENWRTYETIEKVSHPPWGNRTAVVLEPDVKGLKDWFVNVQTPLVLSGMNNVDARRHEQMQALLKTKLGKSDGNTDTSWPWWRYVRKDLMDWETLIPELWRECHGPEEGRITRYFVDTFVSLAVKAIPVIDKIEVA